uniref:small glutamine-rich tetratricopeptide repeat-containing protein beta isoform X2 n=1 Tax=Oncorhynchus gorbuscha TaxID=8017 RepID=UPI001EAE9D27|nr:small glutamine-rich tetratricopeptide repeat-containing protein beta isoform X2 [Oncorhynchus gorbuscha]
MAVEKRLAFSIVQFLRDQTHCGALNSDEQESLEVAIQCLETTFKINSSDCHLAAPQPLTEIFLNSLLKNDQNNLVLPETSPSPEDTERAEQLKNEGNNHMKEENYSCAVECYTKAIDLDLRNAVYFCNRLALTAMNKYPEAISYFKKALVLDPGNDTYKSNLKIAEQKQKEASSPMATGLGFDMASLINNPAFISMAASVMQNQQVQQLMSGMMSNAVGGPAAGVGGLSDISSLIEAGQQFAQQIQQQNPELIEQLRNHIRSRSFSGSAEEHS